MDLVPENDDAPIAENRPAPVFIPLFWDQRIPFLHRVVSVLAGILLPLVAISIYEKSFKQFGSALILAIIVSLPYRFMFILMSTLSYVLWYDSAIGWAFYLFGIAAILAGRLTKFPFWVNAYLTRIAIIILNYYYITKLGGSGA